MVEKNTKKEKSKEDKKFAKGDTSYSSFWLFNKNADMNSEHFKDSFVNFYDEKELLSEFNPSVAKNVISFWSEENDVVLDPFSGRTRALVSYSMNRSYIGFEVSKDVVNYMYDKFDSLNILNKHDFYVDVINDDCLNIDNHMYMDADLIFSCPPYWNLEKYETCDGQLSDIDNYDTFLNELYKRLDTSIQYLKKNKFMCMVVGDFRKDGVYTPFHCDLVKMMQHNNNVVLHDMIAVQNLPFHVAAFYFGASRKKHHTAKSHEYLLVWRKIK